MQNAARQRGRAQGGRVWVKTYRESDGTVVRGHWRSEPGVSTLKKDDLRPVIDAQLKQHVHGLIAQHAQAVQAGATQRAGQVKAELQAYARALATPR
jgi:hypothetical protein